VASEPLTDAAVTDLRSDIARGAYDQDMCDYLEPLLDEVTRARALLQRIEWIPGVVTWNCPACGGAKDGGGHRAGCELAALIGRKKSATSPDG
jgi:hypothetical protein